MITRCVLCGVGGQGTILAAHVMAEVAMRNNLDVKVSEIHGMSQRGGSVSTVVTFGQNVESMVCGKNCADILVSFDILETLRNLDTLKEQGRIISNDEVIKPMSVLTGKASLPKDSRQKLLDLGATIVPAAACAKEAGNPKASNVVLLGALSALLPFDKHCWEEVISSHVPQKTIEANLTAFKLGREFVEERL